MINNIKLGYDDISIVPECVSNIRSRKECSFFTETLSLPIFAAPMDTVVNEECAVNFIESSINVVYPRTIPLQRRLELLNICKLNQWSFIAFSLSEAQDIFLNKTKKHDLSYKNTAIKVMREKINCGTLSCNICIDIANGHMVELIDSIKKIKQRYGKKVIIMSGNIANPNTYKKYEEAGCDFVRCSIGSGSRCTTSSNVSVHFACFSLIKEMWQIKQKINGKCKIVADGGIKGYGDIQKALLYADYVMIGGLFNKAIDSAGTPVYGRFYSDFFGKKILNPFKTFLYYGKTVKKKDYQRVLKLIKDGKVDVWKDFYGMSTKIAQAKINPNGKLKTSEGKIERQKVEYSIKQWSENEIDFLRSAMSYTNSKTLEEYKNSEWIQITHKSYNM